MSASRFIGKVAIVTGAGSGIGRATTIRLLNEGAQVVATDLMPDRLAELDREVATDALVTVAGDIANEDVVHQVVAAAGERIDVLVNNAGIMDGFLPAGEVDDATWQRVLDVNVTSVMRLTRAVLPSMVAAGAGAIVNVASEAGLRGGCAGVAYTTSKAAVIGFTKNTAFMYQPDGIRVNAVAPGATATNIKAPFLSERGAARLGPVLSSTVPARATPEHLAAAITWLASDDSVNVTGAVLASDGGWSAI
jgi:NAD(P)-dependent dehydrogenase (short-subunit alcohol dehydrogenase family)